MRPKNSLEGDIDRNHFFLCQDLGNDRRNLLFGCGCCRRAWHLLYLDASRRLVELAEACADGEATEEELEVENSSPEFSCMSTQALGNAGENQFPAPVVYAIEAARCLADNIGLEFIARNTSLVPNGTGFPYPSEDIARYKYVRRDDEEWSIRCKFLRDVFYNEFQQISFDTSWMTEHTIGIASKMYDERNFHSMLILADALEDAGCNDLVILNHCRDETHHIRGCWVVDLILGK